MKKPNKKRLLDIVEALQTAVITMDNDLVRMGKGRDLSSLPGFQGQNILDCAGHILDQYRPTNKRLHGNGEMTHAQAVEWRKEKQH